MVERRDGPSWLRDDDDDNDVNYYQELLYAYRKLPHLPSPEPWTLATTSETGSFSVVGDGRNVEICTFWCFLASFGEGANDTIAPVGYFIAPLLPDRRLWSLRSDLSGIMRVVHTTRHYVLYVPDSRVVLVVVAALFPLNGRFQPPEGRWGGRLALGYMVLLWRRPRRAPTAVLDRLLLTDSGRHHAAAQPNRL